MKTPLLRNSLLALVAALLLSCGGGGGGSAGSGGAASSAGTVSADGGGGGQDSGAGTPGSTSGTGADSAGTATASGDGSGVGSGGTGVTTADAVGIGSVDGLGSIILNSLRYNTDAAVVRVDDAPSLQIGMTVKVTGSIDADFTSATAKLVESAAELRGPVSSISSATGSFVVMGTTVTTDGSTVWGNTAGLGTTADGTTLQVWGLPASPGTLRATRVEQQPASAPIVTGTVQGHIGGLRRFTLGGLTIDYSAARFAGIDAGTLADGTIVRVRADAMTGNALIATLVQAWNPIPRASDIPLQLAGVVTDAAQPEAFRVLGVPVDASQARITGGPARSVGNGVKVEVDGIHSNGVLRASKLRIRHMPGTGGPVSFAVIGPIGSFVSPASFRVRGQAVNASVPGVVFFNGTAADLANGTRVSVSGAQIDNGVLIADRVSFE